MFKLPLKVLIGASFDLLFKKKFEGDSYSDYIISKYGKTLYNSFFRDYTEKFCLIPPEKIHYTWATASVDRAVIDKKVKMDSLFDTIKSTLMPKPVETKFIYPPKGVYVFSEKLSKLIKNNKGRVITSVKNISLKKIGNKISEVVYDGKSIKTDLLVWTAPINLLSKKLEIQEAKLTYLDTVMYNVMVNKKIDNPNQWIYYGDNDIFFIRVSIPSNFSKDTVPKRKGGICVEVAVENIGIWNHPEKYLSKLKEGLEKVELCKKKDIIDIKIEKVKNTYPLYHIDYLKELKKLKLNIERFKNIICSGRTGNFHYNNMDNSIEEALKLAKEISGK